jgi:dTDP-4-dehydrorhamnose 3,5-epimerase
MAISMRIEKTAIEGVWIIQNEIYPDQRGTFQEWFQREQFREITGVDFNPQQANSSVSNIGVIRGIHYSTAKVGQAKLVTCMSGQILDVIFDIRIGSKTFGQHVSIPMRAQDGTSVYISEGLGHSFISLEENSNLVYLLSAIYDPQTEHAVNPLDATLGFQWPLKEVILSKKDAAAPSLDELYEANILPRMN